jgi:hypothetical protein
VVLEVNAKQLRSLFDSLDSPQQAGTRIYSAKRIAPAASYRIGKDVNGNPSLLIDAGSTLGSPQLADFEGKHLRVNHGLNCTISQSEGKLERTRISVVTCHDADGELIDRFFDAIEVILRSVGDMPDSVKLRRIIAGLTELFQMFGRPPQGTVQGLWTELWLIAHSDDPRELLATWHVKPTAAFDFSAGDQRIELKSSSTSLRRHRFSHRQLTPPSSTQAVVVSVLVEAMNAGTSLADLLDAIRQRVDDPELIVHLQRVVAETLGNEWRSALRMAYDAQLASDSLRFYAAERVPSLSSPIPSAISDLRYTVDLSATESLTFDQALSMGGIVAAAVPASSHC